jgi:ligand-binding sensor domain-containing protein
MKYYKTILLALLSIVTYGQKADLITSENSNLPENDIWSIEVDQQGTKWFGTANSGLVSYKDGEIKIYNDSTSAFAGKFIGPIYSDKNQNLWISTSKPNQLYIFKDSKFTKVAKSNIDFIESVIAIAEDLNGALYFGGYNGVLKFENDVWTKVELPVKGITVRALAVNENGELAIGHNEGLIIGKEGNFISYEEKEDELQISVVRGLKYINIDELIIGYGGGFGNGGFSIKNHDNWKHFNRENSKLINHMVRDIEVDENEIYWMATNDGLSYYKDGEANNIMFREGNYKNTIMDIATDGEEIWIATNFGIIRIK